MLPRRPSSGEPGACALDAAYREHLPAILRYLARRLGDDAASDAAAEVFIRAVRAERGRTAITLAWLYGVAGNVISERRRSERRRLRAIERIAATQAEPKARTEAAQPLEPTLIEALKALTPADRETLLLVAWGELSYEQTAEALHIPVGTVRSRLARARKQLISHLPAEHQRSASELSGDLSCLT